MNKKYFLRRRGPVGRTEALPESSKPANSRAFLLLGRLNIPIIQKRGSQIINSISVPAIPSHTQNHNKDRETGPKMAKVQRMPGEQLRIDTAGRKRKMIRKSPEMQPYIIQKIIKRQL